MLTFSFNNTATTVIYTYCPTRSLPDALPISARYDGYTGPLAMSFHSVALRAVEKTLPSTCENPSVAANAAKAAALQKKKKGKKNKKGKDGRSEEHTSELQSLMRIAYAVYCLKTKNKSRRKSNK